MGLHCKIGFQDLFLPVFKVFNFAKRYMNDEVLKKYGIPNSAICLFNFCPLQLMTVYSFGRYFAMIVFHE